MLGDYRAAQMIVGRGADAFASVPTLHYVPIEGTDLPPAWESLWSVVHPVAMSKFGAKQIAKVMGHPVPMVYHGVDTDTFRPLDDKPLIAAPRRWRPRCR